MKFSVLNLKKIIEPIWAHRPGFGINPKTGKSRKQNILEQSTTPQDKRILEKLKIKKKDKVLAIAGFYASWASKIQEAGAIVSYSDISSSMVNYVKKKIKIRFFEYITANYELIPKAVKKYDWTFVFEACNGSQGLPIAYLRSLLNNKGGILVYYDREGKDNVSTGNKPHLYPAIVTTLAKLYNTKFLIKKIYFEGHTRITPISKIPHMVFWLFTNQEARQKALLDLNTIDLIFNKRNINLKEDSRKLNISPNELKDSLKRISQLSKLIKKEFTKTIEVK
ncbi:MAG: hypothetical protein NTX24_01030 [Candidatus Pacearchaeota archaeon]|nr:hypothetical protein [Candidatus Pacearchaeota archaeon]